MRLLLVLLAGCAMRRTPHYEPVPWELEAPDDTLAVALPLWVAEDLEKGRLRSLEVDGTPVAADEVHTLPAEPLWALFSCTRGWARGAELDLLVDDGRGGSVPVTVRMSTRREASLSWGSAGPTTPAPAGADPVAYGAELAARYGLAGFEDGDVPWTLEALGDVEAALSRLDPDVLPVLSGVVFGRSSESPRADRELAYFDPRAEPPRVDFFDGAFTDWDGAFVGPVDAPVRAGAMTVLHEVGHAVADWPLRRAYLDYLDLFAAAQADPSRWSEVRPAWRAYRRLGRRGAVIEAWEALRDGRLGPSSYGFRDPHESFAEAFALAHLDPEALERALPGAVAWFEAGHPLRAAGLAPSTRPE